MRYWPGCLKDYQAKATELHPPFIGHPNSPHKSKAERTPAKTKPQMNTDKRK